MTWSVNPSINPSINPPINNPVINQYTCSHKIKRYESFCQISFCVLLIPSSRPWWSYIFSIGWNDIAVSCLTSIVIQKLNSGKVHEIIFIILFTWEGGPDFLKKQNHSIMKMDSYIIENLVSSFTIMTPTILRKEYNGWLMKALPPSTIHPVCFSYISSQ